MGPNIPVWFSIVGGISNNNEALRQDDLSRLYQAMGGDYGVLNFIDYGDEEDANGQFDPNDWAIPEPVSPLSDSSEDIPTSSTPVFDQEATTQTNEVTPLRRDIENMSHLLDSPGNHPTSSKSAFRQKKAVIQTNEVTAIERNVLETTPTSSLLSDLPDIRPIISTSMFFEEHMSKQTNEVNPMRRYSVENTTISQIANRSTDIPTSSTLVFNQEHASALTTEVSPMRRDDIESTPISSHCSEDRLSICSSVFQEYHSSTRTNEINPMRGVDVERTPVSHLSNRPRNGSNSSTSSFYQESSSIRTFEVAPIRNLDKENVPVEIPSTSGEESPRDFQQAAAPKETEPENSLVEERHIDRHPLHSLGNTRVVRPRYRNRHNYK